MIREVEFDLDDFTEDEMIEHLESYAHHLDMKQIKRLRNVIKEGEENLVDDILKENEIYTLVTSYSTINDEIKIKIILENLHKFSLTEISKIFEK